MIITRVADPNCSLIKLRSARGISSVDASILFVVVSVSMVFMMPFIFRHHQGYLFFQNTRSFDRQFDPQDSSREDLVTTNQNAMQRTSYAGMPSAGLFAPYPVFQIGDMYMAQENLPTGPVPRESVVTKQQTNSGLSTSDQNYLYQDNIQSVF
jgi:hypothetical protein